MDEELFIKVVSSHYKPKKNDTFKDSEAQITPEGYVRPYYKVTLYYITKFINMNIKWDIEIELPQVILKHEHYPWIFLFPIGGRFGVIYLRASFRYSPFIEFWYVPSLRKDVLRDLKNKLLIKMIIKGEAKEKKFLTDFYEIFFGGDL